MDCPVQHPQTSPTKNIFVFKTDRITCIFFFKLHFLQKLGNHASTYCFLSDKKNSTHAQTEIPLKWWGINGLFFLCHVLMWTFGEILMWHQWALGLKKSSNMNLWSLVKRKEMHYISEKLDTFWHWSIQQRSHVKSIRSSEVFTLNSMTCSAQVPKNFSKITSDSCPPIMGLILLTNCNVK